jgi:hypothetical protein
LPISGAPRGLEFFVQSRVLAAQPFVLQPQRLAIPLGALRTFAQRIDLVARRARVARPFIWHVDVMPDPRKSTSTDIGSIIREGEWTDQNPLIRFSISRLASDLGKLRPVFPTLIQVILELRVDVEPSPLSCFDFPTGFIKAAGLHIYYGDVVVGLAEFRIRVDGGLPFSFGFIPVTVSEVRAANSKQYRGRRLEQVGGRVRPITGRSIGIAEFCRGECLAKSWGRSLTVPARPIRLFPGSGYQFEGLLARPA